MIQTVRNPRTGERDYTFEPADGARIAATCERLRRGQAAWAEATPPARAAVLQRGKAALQARRDEIVAALFCDTGRMRETLLEFDGVCRAIDRWCDWAPPWLAPQSPVATTVPFLQVAAQDVAYPLVGVISPWNFPLLLSLIDAIPALLAGSAVVIKPSEVTPRFIEPVRQAIAAVPELDAVLAYEAGAGATGEALIGAVDTVCFTGSVATGRKVAEAAASAFIPAFLELGGKDPALVLADADVERTSAALVWGSMSNAGQACQSIERVYVQAPLFNTLVESLAERLSSLRFCTGTDPAAGELAPVIAASQAGILQAHLDDAVAKGAKVVCGGRIENIGGGLWCQPTLLTRVDHSMLVMTEETFGPILPVMAFGEEEEGIGLANDSRFGLSAAVFSSDRARARAVAARLQVGAVSINDSTLTAVMHEGEKQAFKLSGMGGSRMGRVSLRRFVRRKALLENTELAWDPWWYHQA
ncbi:aldehyde dehydrogenase family protein [Exilibacterium tricleocarpae]|uniref:Aldehyde dehydrogenase family protein n=1 Tax=Exilibacterium tricleocarpae TaxID=2591008 RepID=A0A545TVK2_9GAMM|nr:aldehyde dehydrogenase family protein [Exilibacterium tricleocarpae]TQV81245.1 aldehyde dehydrogenase family protein [Exilibacterium tricleocarpae]